MPPIMDSSFTSSSLFAATLSLMTITSLLPCPPTSRRRFIGLHRGTLASLMLLGAQSLPQFDDRTYEAIIGDPRAHIETVYMSYAGIATARVTSFISTFSSCLILFLILRSANRLSTSYHRLVFGMSVTDIFFSLAIFSYTWLMPKEMIYTQFQSLMHGNESTCTAQGSVFFLGSIGTFGFNTALCIYYASVIRFKCSEEGFRKRVEPLLFVLAIGVPLLIIVPIIFFDLFAPFPWGFTCTVVTYPYWCSESTSTGDDDESGGNGEYGECSETKNIIFWIRMTMVGLHFVCTVIIFSSMFIVSWTAYMQEQTLRRYAKSSGSNIDVQGRTRNTKYLGNGGQEEVCDPQHSTMEEFRVETKIVCYQALGYLAAFLVCQLFPLFALLNTKNDSVQILRLLLRPLQGLFNFFIFIGHKIHNKRRADDSLTWCQAIWKVFISPGEEPTMFVGNITMVVRYGGDDNDMLDINFSDVRQNSVGVTSLIRNATIEPNTGATTGMVDFKQSTPSIKESTNRRVSSSKESGLNYVENSRGSNELIHKDIFDDNSLEGLENNNQSYTIGSSNAHSGQISLFSRKSPNSGGISNAIS